MVREGRKSGKPLHIYFPAELADYLENLPANEMSPFVSEACYKYKELIEANTTAGMQRKIVSLRENAQKNYDAAQADEDEANRLELQLEEMKTNILAESSDIIADKDVVIEIDSFIRPAEKGKAHTIIRTLEPLKNKISKLCPGFADEEIKMLIGNRIKTLYSDARMNSERERLLALNS